jgi:hypothetical protein
MKVKDEPFARKPLSTKSPPMQRHLLASMKELDIEKRALRLGVGKTGATCMSHVQSFFGGAMFLTVLYFLGKNQIWPFIKPRVTRITL